LQEEKEDPFAIPRGKEIGDEYIVPFKHPKEEGDVPITIYLKEGDKGEPMRYVNMSHAVLLTKKSRDTAIRMLKAVKRYKFEFMGNVQLVRYDDVKSAIAAANRPMDKGSST
jgi:hypothetical protein